MRYKPVEEVEQVHPHDLQRAADGGRSARARVGRDEARHATAERSGPGRSLYALPLAEFPAHV